MLLTYMYLQAHVQTAEKWDYIHGVLYLRKFFQIQNKEKQTNIQVGSLRWKRKTLRMGWRIYHFSMEFC